MALSGEQPRPHIAIIPSSGMGHLIPSSRLATTLASKGCHVSLVVFHPMVSSAESNSVTALFATFPSIHPIHLNVVPFTDPGADPFLLQFEAIRQSSHLLLPLLTSSSSSSPPITSVIVDMTLASTFLPVISPTGISTFVYFIASATMLSLCAYFPTHINENINKRQSKDVEIPGVGVIPMASLPPPLHHPNDHLFAIQFIDNGRAFMQANGVLVNTFEALEAEALTALSNGVVVPGFPPVFAVGPLKNLPLKETSSPEALSWLDAQTERSVLYVSFGSRTALSLEQIRELGVGLELSGVKFLWVIKTKKVDKQEEAQLELEDLLGEELVKRINERGSLVVRTWVEQEEILKHGAVGGFLTHCGWNSVMEAAMHGVPLLAWALNGDQRVNAEIVRRSGLGIWAENWSWGGEEKVVMGEEIGERVKELMESSAVRSSAARLAVEAMKAVGDGGSTEKSLAELIAKLKG